MIIVNKFAKKCQSCGKKVGAGEGFAYNNGPGWFTTCASAACHRHLGIKIPSSLTNPNAMVERKITEDGFIYMPFDRAAIPLIKSIPGAKFYKEDDEKNPTPGTVCWGVSTKPADIQRTIEVCEKLELYIPDVLKQRASAGTDESRAALERADKNTSDGKVLYSFQKIGVEFLALHNRALLADDMGIGKSPTALVALPENSRVIIICPASLKYNWRDEVMTWRPEYKVIICEGRESFHIPEPGEITIINYDILPAFLSPTKDSGKVSSKGNKILTANLTKEQEDALKEVTIIGDEFHLVKNYKSSRSKKTNQLARICKRMWALTGTPLMNRPFDLFGVLAAGNMNPFGSFECFVRLFNGYPNQWGGYEFGMPQPEVSEILHRIMLRRLKTEVLKDLPKKIYKDIEVDITPAIIKQLDKFLGNIIDDKKPSEEEITQKLDLVDLPSFKQFSEIRKLLAISRIPAMLEVVESYEESDTPLVVFSAHLAPIEELGKRDGWKIITGDTESEDRRNIVREFQEGKLKGVGLTIGAGGVGITLTHASNVLYVDLDWTPAMNIQSEDRLVRIGATSDNVLIMRMSSSHPLDQHIQKLLQHKMQLAYRALEVSINFEPLPPRQPGVAIVEETDAELLARINSASDEAEHEIAIWKLQGILGRESAKVMDVPEPELTPGRKVMLRNALDYMISVCDGAETRDAMGFNKPDAYIARWVGQCLRDEDDVSYRVLERILVRYRRQLKGKFEEIWKPAF